MHLCHTRRCSTHAETIHDGHPLPVIVIAHIRLRKIAPKHRLEACYIVNRRHLVLDLGDTCINLMRLLMLFLPVFALALVVAVVGAGLTPHYGMR